MARKLYCNELLFSGIHIKRWQPGASPKLMAIESHIMTDKLAAAVRSTASAMFSPSPLDLESVKAEKGLGRHRT